MEGTMKAKPLQMAKPPVEEAAEMRPLVTTNVAGSFKGGALKTSVAVALAERLALSGLNVVLLACDNQEDARNRLGLKSSDPGTARVKRGAGTITLVESTMPTARRLLYDVGFAQLGTVDTVVVDTPPVRYGGSLPGVLLFATTDGDDATRSLVSMLRLTPQNTDIVLVRYHTLTARPSPEEWEEEVDAITQAVGEREREMIYLTDPLPRSDPVKKALDAGQSVWDLPRRNRTLEFLTGVETMAEIAWRRIRPGSELPPRPRRAPGYVRGWEDEDD
jgi:CobQ/CobB/MinD/ParA nucleotide binding domain